MGFLDNLKEIGAGIVDIFTAPVGLVYDTVRAIGSDSYNPGFFGTFGPATDKAVGGIARISENTGVTETLAFLGDTPVGDAFMGFWEEVELLYSTEFQRTEGRTAGLFGALGAQPGDISLQRGAGFAANLAGGAIRGAIDATPFSDVQQEGRFDPVVAWRRTASQSPGQAIYESILTDFQRLTPSRQDEVKSTAHYIMLTGSLDMVSRWYLSPEVWMGKGLGKLRRTAFVYETLPALKAAARENLRMGKSKETISGMKAYNLGADEPQTVYATVRSSEVEQLVEEGSLKLGKGVDDVLDADGIHAATQDSLAGQSTGRGRTQLVEDEITEAAQRLGIEGDPSVGVLQDYLGRGLEGRVAASGTGAPGAVEDVVHRIDELVALVERGDPTATREFIEALRRGGASDDFVDVVVDQLETLNTSGALARINGTDASNGFLGDRAARIGRPPRYIGQSDRAVHLSSDIDEVRAYAAALHAADPTDMPLIIRIEANNMPVVYTDVDIPIQGLKGDPAFFTTAEKLRGQEIRIERMSAEALDPALQKGVVDYLEPQGSLNQRLYNFDGTPIEPSEIVKLGDMAEDFRIVNNPDMDAVQAERYLNAKNAERNFNNPGRSFFDHARSSRIIHQVVNRMDGMSAADIRFSFFQRHAMGQEISSDLASAANFAERRTILLAYMGHRLPEIDQLGPILKAKLDIMLKELDNVRNGQPANSVIDMMMDKPGKWTNVPPERLGEVAQEMIAELKDQVRFADYLEKVSRAGPLGEISMPYGRLAALRTRKTSIYQESPFARPIRVVTEMKAHRYMNVGDGLSDHQLRRQLEEAATLGISGAEVDDFINRYMKPGLINEEKINIVIEAENLIITRAAKKAGMTTEEIQDLISHAEFGRQHVQDILQNRRYAPKGRDLVPDWNATPDPDTGMVDLVHMPMLETQLKAWIPLSNVAAIKRAVTTVGRFRRKYGRTVTGGLDTFYRIWKPSVLLRGGWTIRVVGDEQLRVLAKLGSITNHLAAIELGENPAIFGQVFKGLGKEVGEGGISGGQRAGEALSVAFGTRPIVGLSVRAANVFTKAARKLKLVDEDVYAEMAKISGPENLVSARIGHGGPSESILRELETMMGRVESSYLDRMRNSGTGQWRSIDPADPGFGEAWGRVLSQQFGHSTAGRKITGDILEMMNKGKISARGTTDILSIEATPEVIERFTKWLKTTREGQEVARTMPWRANNPEKWAEDLIETLGEYTGGLDKDLLEGIMQQKVTGEMLSKVDEFWWPSTVHAEMVDQVVNSRNALNQGLNDFFSTLFDTLGRMPTDTLSRQPMFKQVFGVEMVRMRKTLLAQGGELTEDTLRIMEKTARATGIAETRFLLYDLAEVSRFGEMMRFMTPFYSAWQEVITRWAGLAFNDPSVIARARMIWKAPNRADMVYVDDDGNEFIQFRLSPKAADKLGLTGWQRYLAEGGLRVGKSSFNLVLNSPLPGVGPLIQYPINEVVTRKPELEEALKFLLPFGVASDSSRIFLSPLVRQLQNEIAGPNANTSWKRTWADALTWMDLEYRTGRRSIPPTEDEASSIARALWTLRLVTRLASPVQPIFDTPLKPFIDTYRDLIDTLGPEDADEAFLNEHGSEFFAVTLSRTVSATGIPPTVEGEIARRAFVEIIDKFPEYGRLIIGDDALGEFSTGAFAAQLLRPIDPDNPDSEMERVYRTTELDPRTGRIMEVDRRLGWQEYIQFMDMIDLERKRLGLPNLRVKGAQHLARTKTELIEIVATKYPAWWDDFNTRDDLKWDRRISSLREISKVPTLGDRADIQGLQTYLEYRSLMLQELNRRKMAGGASTFRAVANEDLQDVWETLMFQLLNDNIAFQPLYFRYLEGDTLLLRTQDNG